MSKRKPKFPVGTRVEDRDSGEQGVVVHVFQGDPGASRHSCRSLRPSQ